MTRCSHTKGKTHKEAHSSSTFTGHMVGVSLEAWRLIRALSHCTLRVSCVSFRLEKQVINQLVMLRSSDALGLRASLPAAAASVAAASGGTPYLAPPLAPHPQPTQPINSD
ncbi:hypothetical protein E2C01_000892 [Portunus trituberculatus]|uniref:Uncharacterized protein n=1 Tax=Portunus trituberculatus TaxID=210409 RepID=A0A5B7CHU4_PORTR|nr:hypothetical protein [Portunus trituberculatus]